MIFTLSRHRFAFSVPALVIAGALLAGCTGMAPQNDPTNSTSAGPSSGPAPIDAEPTAPPEFFPDGSAAENLPIFSQVVVDQWNSGSGTNGQAYVDALIAVGFVAETVDVTASKTTIGNDVDSLQIAVLWQGTCLLGQVGPSTGVPVATTLPELKDGGCFVADSAQP